MKQTKPFVMLKRQGQANEVKRRRAASGVKMQSGLRAGRRYDSAGSPIFGGARNR